jgi:hypothetical protein
MAGSSVPSVQTSIIQKDGQTMHCFYPYWARLPTYIPLSATALGEP